jgi:5-methylcytosine-specific restriction endonuclease McrA
MTKLSAPVLVLSSSYEAVQICSAKRAVLLQLAGKAHVVEKSSEWLRSPSIRLAVPEVIRLHRYVRMPYQEVPFTRRNVFLRDGYRCQYCGREGTADSLTIDHVVPFSRGGRDLWTNVVTACRRCNNMKGNQLLQESGLRLDHEPRAPTSLTFLQIMRQHGKRRSVWRKYLFFGDELDLVPTGTQ